jgi:peptidoglycan/xylan/chitin deacetylase (PgdA/CDA1 family)
MNNSSGRLKPDQYLKFSSIGVLYSITTALIPFGNFLAYGQNDSESEIPITQCKCVAFRLDDIQDYWLDNVQVGIIDTFVNNNASLTVGVIGNHFGGDQYVVSYLKSRLSNDIHSGQVSLEIANHGWNHEDFTLFNKAEQSQLIAKTNQKLFSSLGVKPSVFIPPLNRLNDDTISAVLENDIHYLSGNITDYPRITSLPSSGTVNASSVIYHLPSSVATGDLVDDDTEWQGFTHTQTLDGINDSVHKYGYAVVTLHPQEYSVRNGLLYDNVIDRAQMNELESVIKEVQNQKIPIVTISQISNYGEAPEFTDMLLYPSVLVPFSAILLYHKIMRRFRSSSQ